MKEQHSLREQGCAWVRRRKLPNPCVSLLLDQYRPVQKSYPHLSLVLLPCPPSCTCKSWCLMARLPPWQDGAAAHLARSLLSAVLSLSSHPQARAVYRNGSSLLSAVFRFFFQNVYIHPPAWVGQTRNLIAGKRGHCPQGQPCSSSVACQGNLDVEEPSIALVC